MIFDDVGEPDGGTVDINNNYWSARVRGSCIICIDTIKEKIIQKIELPTKTPTCLTFGGTDMQDLFVTSLRPKPINNREDGNLFKVRSSAKGHLQLLSEI